MSGIGGLTYLTFQAPGTAPTILSPIPNLPGQLPLSGSNTQTQNVSASGTAPLTYSIDGPVPTGVSINAVTGQISVVRGAGGITASGVQTVTVRVTNAYGTAQQLVSIGTAGNNNLEVSSPPGQPVTLGVNQTQGTAPTSYTMLTGPGWFNWSGTQGTGTPPAPGYYTGTIQGCSSSASCTVSGPLCSTQTFGILVM